MKLKRCRTHIICIAKKLATKLKVDHKFYYTDLSNEPIELMLQRFLLNGEGRIDHLAGYLDGFRIWQTLYNDGVQGVMRGDEAFGGKKRTTSLAVRLFNDLGLCSDWLKDWSVTSL